MDAARAGVHRRPGGSAGRGAVREVGRGAGKAPVPPRQWRPEQADVRVRRPERPAQARLRHGPHSGRGYAVEVPLDDPEEAEVIGSFDLGENPNGEMMQGCHDMGVILGRVQQGGPAFLAAPVGLVAGVGLV